MSEGSMRRWLSSPAAAAPLPDNEDLLQEILLRLPPLPSSLPRASLVCKRWRRLLSEPQFVHRFIAHHHRDPPLLGLFVGLVSAGFRPTLDPPDCIPSARLSQAFPRGERWDFLDCRHGVALLLNRMHLEVTLWDPVTGDRCCVAIPPALLDNKDTCGLRNGALLVHAGHAGRVPLRAFSVVLLMQYWRPGEQDFQTLASIYESQAGVWGDLISTTIKDPVGGPSIHVQNSLYWRTDNKNDGILEFDLNEKSLAVIKYPVGTLFTQNPTFQILRMEDGGLGVAISSGMSIQLWERKADSDDGASWLLQKTIEPHRLIPPRSQREGPRHAMLGYDEDGHVMFVSKGFHVYMIELKTMHFKYLFQSHTFHTCHPYRSFYTSGKGISNADVGAETLRNS